MTLNLSGQVLIDHKKALKKKHNAKYYRKRKTNANGVYYEVLTCDLCGSQYKRCSKSSHKRSKKCKAAAKIQS